MEGVKDFFNMAFAMLCFGAGIFIVVKGTYIIKSLIQIGSY